MHQDSKSPPRMAPLPGRHSTDRALRRLRPAAIDGTLASPTMPLRLLPLVLLATCLAATPGLAQFGKPFWLRDPTPTIEDAAPGREPAPEAKVVPEIYRRQPVFYRSNEAPGTIIIDTRSASST